MSKLVKLKLELKSKINDIKLLKKKRDFKGRYIRKDFFNLVRDYQDVESKKILNNISSQSYNTIRYIIETEYRDLRNGYLDNKDEIKKLISEAKMIRGKILVLELKNINMSLRYLDIVNVNDIKKEDDEEFYDYENNIKRCEDYKEVVKFIIQKFK